MTEEIPDWLMFHFQDGIELPDKDGMNFIYFSQRGILLHCWTGNGYKSIESVLK